MALIIDWTHGEYDKDWNFQKDPSIVLSIDGVTDSEHTLSLKVLADALRKLKEKDDEDK